VALDRADAYDELRAAFTAAVSHEFRTPLARIAALLEGALLDEGDAPRLVAQARDEVAELSHLVDEVLFLSELETGNALVTSGRTPVAGVVAQVFSELRERAERAEVELRADVEPAFELPLRRRLVRVVVENLAENAIRYAGAGSVFVLTARKEKEALTLIGSDNGAGVSRADLPRLFERFYRADRARGSRGTGLGLAIVKHVVTAAGGSVQARTDRGGGLTISCRFPSL
jgi:two-component system, OmpR family, phosphate regulon sensor histidine kinase PhoR